MILDYKNYFNNSVKILKIKNFYDLRGKFSQIYEKKDYSLIGIKNNFIQDNYSYTKKINTIRGLHYQTNPFQQAKLLTILKGGLLDVVVDLRKDSKFYGNSMTFNLSDKSFNQIFIPRGFAHGFKSKTENVEILYKVDNLYSKKNEKTIMWNDKILKINWKINRHKPILSKKDTEGDIFNFKNIRL
jgi:dTDP-4-dehydrorhamnose 3,5-epimerase